MKKFVLFLGILLFASLAFASVQRDTQVLYHPEGVTIGHATEVASADFYFVASAPADFGPRLYSEVWTYCLTTDTTSYTRLERQEEGRYISKIPSASPESSTASQNTDNSSPFDGIIHLRC